MINCFIDPIFLTKDDNLDIFTYSMQVFNHFSSLLDKIEEIESNGRIKFFNFNLNVYYINECLKINPFTTDDERARFEDYISLIFRIYVNEGCEENYIYNPIHNPAFIDENKYIKPHMINYWNSYINQCSNCRKCQQLNFSLLTCKNFGTKKKKGCPDYFQSRIPYLISWLYDNIVIPNLIEFFPTRADNEAERIKKFLFLLNIFLFKRLGTQSQQQIKMNPNFWNSNLLIDNDMKLKEEIIRVMVDLIEAPNQLRNKRKFLMNEFTMINNNKVNLEQCYIMQTYQFRGRLIRPRLRFAIKDNTIYFEDIINRQ